MLSTDISQSAIIHALMAEKREEIAVTYFCEEIMTEKQGKQRRR